MKSNYRRTLRLLLLLSGSYLVSACDNDNAAPAPAAPAAPPAMASFNVTVLNMTNAQPLSPVAVIAHQDGYSFFSIGSTATVGLEEMEEGGDDSAFLAEADADAMVTVTASGAMPIGPGASEVVTVDLLESELPGTRISVATMLVNTNDAFSGLDAILVDSMAVGELLRFRSIAYDAGTEADSEQATAIPGPAGGGEGFNAARDDQADQVSMHSGVVSRDDGFATSDLTEQHRFDNPVAQILIVRTD